MSTNLTAIDLFAGAGGATQGLRDAGYAVIGAVENDPIAAATYRLNHPDTHLWERDIRRLTAAGVARELRLVPGELSLLKACPPCQGFSTLAGGRLKRLDDDRNDLVGHTVRFVRALRPQSVLVENVPGLGRDWRSEALERSLGKLGYAVRSYVVDAATFGVPQHRRRFLMIAIRGKRVELPAALGDGGSSATVREAFRALEAAVAKDDELHIPAQPQGLVARRIRAVPVGGNRFDLPDHLQLECHKKLGTRSAGGSYGRMKWDEPAPTMTTRCTTPACGSFIHPDLDRAITLREAAAIQTFPHDYRFVGSRGAVERQIGNAVPVLMARQVAGTIRSLMRNPTLSTPEGSG